MAVHAIYTGFLEKKIVALLEFILLQVRIYFSSQFVLRDVRFLVEVVPDDVLTTIVCVCVCVCVRVFVCVHVCVITFAGLLFW